jgi:nitroreductase
MHFRNKLNRIMTPAQTTALLRNRRSIFPKMYNDTPISDAIIQEILENANWAPTHRLTEPWRFKVFRGAARERLSQYLSDWYKANTPEDKFSDKKYEKTKNKPLQSDCVIAICMQRDPEERVPEWEEIASVAMAVQNMWLSCTAHNIGCYWSSPKSILQGNDFLQLAEGERCLGLFYMGNHDLPELPGKRTDIHEKTVWLTE